MGNHNQRSSFVKTSLCLTVRDNGLTTGLPRPPECPPSVRTVGWGSHHEHRLGSSSGSSYAIHQWYSESEWGAWPRQALADGQEKGPIVIQRSSCSETTQINFPLNSLQHNLCTLSKVATSFLWQLLLHIISSLSCKRLQMSSDNMYTSLQCTSIHYTKKNQQHSVTI